MIKRLLVFCFIIVLVLEATVLAGEFQFRFANWPLTNFENHKILNSFSQTHFGVDIAAVEGEEVQAVADGKVYWTYSGGSHGISVGIEHSNGWRTTYLHLSEKSVKKGQEVKASDIIGKTGITGSGRDAVEPHLHFALITDPNADVSNYSQRYGDPLAYGPVIQKPADEPAQQPAEHEQPVMNDLPVEVQPKQEPAIQSTGQLSANILKSSLKLNNVKAKANKIEIKSIETNSLMLSSKILKNALRQHLLRAEEKITEVPVLNTRLEPSKSGDKGRIVIYWLILAAIGYLYHCTRPVTRFKSLVF